LGRINLAWRLGRGWKTHGMERYYEYEFDNFKRKQIAKTLNIFTNFVEAVESLLNKY